MQNSNISLFDFDRLDDKKMLSIDLDGFKNPIKIEYVIYKLHKDNYVYFKIQGIRDIFKYPLILIYSQFKASYSDFFIQILNRYKLEYDTIKLKLNKTESDIEFLQYLSPILF